MKKVFTLGAFLLLSACSFAGKIDFMPNRNAWIESFNSYPIDYSNAQMKLVKTERINEKSFKSNELRTALIGYSLLSDKTFVRHYYAAEKFRAVGNVILSNSSTPYVYHDNDTFELIGTVDIDDVQYGLLPTDLKDFVVLFNLKNGKIYPYTGMIKNERLVLLRQEFVPDNEKFYFEPVYITKIDQSKPVKGFDIKFDGVRQERMYFVYYNYANNQTGSFHEYSFLAQPGLIDVQGIKLKILSVDAQRVDYMVIND